jgi:hypothetical protein
MWGSHAIGTKYSIPDVFQFTGMHCILCGNVKYSILELRIRLPKDIHLFLHQTHDYIILIKCLIYLGQG